LKKNHNKKNYVGKQCDNSRCFQEKNYKIKFLIGSILKKSTKIILKEKTKIKNKKENTKKRKKIYNKTP
jgi:hypothetical protein